MNKLNEAVWSNQTASFLLALGKQTGSKLGYQDRREDEDEAAHHASRQHLGAKGDAECHAKGRFQRKQQRGGRWRELLLADVLEEQRERRAGDAKIEQACPGVPVERLPSGRLLEDGTRKKREERDEEELLVLQADSLGR